MQAKYHCKPRASIRTDDRVHCLTEHIEWNAETYTDKGTASVSNHNRNRQGNHGQRKYNGVSGISIGAKIVCIGNKNLVNNIV